MVIFRVGNTHVKHKYQTYMSLIMRFILYVEHSILQWSTESRKNASIFNFNVSLEYEKTEVDSGFYYKSEAER